MQTRWTTGWPRLALAAVAGVVGFTTVYGVLAWRERSPLPTVDASTAARVEALRSHIPLVEDEGRPWMHASTTADSLVLTVTPTNHRGKPMTNAAVTWTSSDTTIAQIVPMGTSVLVRFVGTGTVNITAEWNAGARQTGTKVFTLTVLPKAVSYSFTWTDTFQQTVVDTLRVGQRHTYRMQVTRSDGSVLAQDSVVWVSSDSTTATGETVVYSYAGGVTYLDVAVVGHAVGTTELALQYGTERSALRLVRVEPAVEGVKMVLGNGLPVGDTLRVSEGETLDVYLIAYDAARRILLIDPTPPDSFPWKIGMVFPEPE